MTVFQSPLRMAILSALVEQKIYLVELSHRISNGQSTLSFIKKSLIKQLVFRVTVLRKICHIASFKTRKMVADGLFMSKLMYLMPLWGGCEDSLLKALQVVQNKVARLVTRRGFILQLKYYLKSVVG